MLLSLVLTFLHLGSFSTKKQLRRIGRQNDDDDSTEVSRSGAGCVLEDVEWVGGDLPPIVGGGGVSLDRNNSEACFTRCDENPRCKWFTFDDRKALCYLKSGRGYKRKRKDGFTSGATFRDGCEEDPRCDSPYRFHRHQCLLFSLEHHPWSPSLADARRNINHTRQLCQELDGFLPYDFAGFSGDPEIGSTWHWVNLPPEEDLCWAGRPNHWSEGVKSFPCSSSLHFACQKRRLFPLPVPAARPLVYAGPRIPTRRAFRPQRIGTRRRQLIRSWNGIVGSRKSGNPFLHFI